MLRIMKCVIFLYCCLNCSIPLWIFGIISAIKAKKYTNICPPLWTRRQHARLSRSRHGFDPRSGQVSWMRCFRGFSSPVRLMSGNFRPPRSPNIIWPSLSPITIHYGRQWPEMLTRPKTSNIIWPSLSSSIIIHYGRQWPEMLTRPNTLNIHTYANICCTFKQRGSLPLNYGHRI